MIFTNRIFVFIEKIHPCYPQLLGEEVAQIQADVCRDFYQNRSTNAFRGFYSDAEKATSEFLAVAQKCAEFFSCKSANQFLFLPSAENFALHQLIYGWGMQRVVQEERVLVFSKGDQGSNLLWQKMSEKTGCDLEIYSGKDVGLLQGSLLERGNLKLLVLPIFSIESGCLWKQDFSDLQKIIVQAKKLGATVVVDVTGFLAYQNIFFPEKFGVDMMFCSSTDFLLSPGVDLCWMKSELLGQTKPIVVGGGVVSFVSQDSFQFLQDKNRYQAGTPNLPQVFSIAKVIELLSQISKTI